ncbi:MAG: CpsD/CapB family tyrosine-protein kinase [candidate division KSB1 bacterium]|nr:CpsD/CapB family tyrosine-protein kinase [candidate division KSB1 bacterium]MDZ7358220.1 CpsD/CapB family tyrosine-protein kinase [candidate division KSB1 bacterium]MDZ7399640.1 CpsD/CapB family tyrosine-protein kinase [candidate division KSB1 bacterium]
MGFIYEALKKAQQEGKWIEPGPMKAMESPDVALADWQLPGEVIKEFSMLKVKIQQAHAQQGIQVFTITSSIPEEGRTTIAYILALMLSQSLNGYHNTGEKYFFRSDSMPKDKCKVLLIDANLERPMLHRLFKASLSPGLTDFFFNSHSNTIFARSVAAGHLYLITAGTNYPHSNDIYNSAAMSELFKRLKENFTYILIDAPAVLDNPGALSLSRLADGVLFVVKANQTRLEVIDEAKLRLQDAGAKILGVVLNERRFFIPEGIYKRI